MYFDDPVCDGDGCSLALVDIEAREIVSTRPFHTFAERLLMLHYDDVADRVLVVSGTECNPYVPPWCDTFRIEYMDYR